MLLDLMTGASPTSIKYLRWGAFFLAEVARELFLDFPEDLSDVLDLEQLDSYDWLSFLLE